jgi:hypothetical protein
MTTNRATGPVLRILLRQLGTWMVWFWAILALVFAGLGFLDERVGIIDGSVWEGAGTAPRWAVFVNGILLPVMYLGFLVSHGITRRTLVVAGAWVGLLISAGMAAAMQAGYLVERAVLARLDRPQTLTHPHLFDTPLQAHLVLLEYALLFAAYWLSGWLVGIGYYRFGGWLGTLFLVPAMVPAAGVDVLLGTGWTDTLLFELHPGADNLAAAIGLSLVLLAAGLAAVHAVTRTVAIKPRTT